MSAEKGPVLIEMEDEARAPEIDPASAPPVPDGDDILPDGPPDGRAVQNMALLATVRPSALWRLFLGAAATLLFAALSFAAWDFVLALLARNVWLGRIVLAAVMVFLVAGIGLAMREWAALARIRRIDRLRHAVEAALAGEDLTTARALTRQLGRLYAHRTDMRWALAALARQEGEVMDADGLLHHAERSLMTPLDAAARREVEAAARQVAAVTAMVPLALADVITALAANLRMVRRIATIYGGRSGGFGSWRLLKTVLLHLVATGAVSVGDDLIGTVMGGGMVGKLSRRFGEGVVNGALTARVGVAAMELCRPMPFDALDRPRVTGLVRSALAGLFGKG